MTTNNNNKDIISPVSSSFAADDDDFEDPSIEMLQEAAKEWAKKKQGEGLLMKSVLKLPDGSEITTTTRDVIEDCIADWVQRVAGKKRKKNSHHDHSNDINNNNNENSNSHSNNNNNNNTDIRQNDSLSASRFLIKDHPTMIAALLNNDLVSLTSSVRLTRANLVPVPFNSSLGYNVYKRTFIFLLQKAISETFPTYQFACEHCFGAEHSNTIRSYYCSLSNPEDLQTSVVTKEVLSIISEKLTQIIREDNSIGECYVGYDEAISYFQSQRMFYSANLVRSRNEPFLKMTVTRGSYSLFHRTLAPSTGSIPNLFELSQFDRNGFIATLPDFATLLIPVFNPIPLIVESYRESNMWGKTMDLECVGRLNEAVSGNKRQETINLCETRHEFKLVEIARDIKTQRDSGRDIKIVLIAGPSSSGKTTFAGRLCVYLRALGIKTMVLSTDNYYKYRFDPTHPKDENGKPDFEDIQAIRLEVLNSHLTKLFNGESVSVPDFDFINGNFSDNTQPISMPNNGVIVMEGLFCLNPLMSSAVAADRKYQIFISPLCQLNLDDNCYISNQTIRVIRRISRDFIHRGRNAQGTLSKWPLLRTGEEKNIFPFVRFAERVFNSSLDYEMCVLRSKVTPLLELVKPGEECFYLARELEKFLSYFSPVPASLVPANSLLQEFLV